MNYLVTISKGSGNGFAYFTIYANSQKEANEIANRLFKYMQRTGFNEGFNGMSSLLGACEI